jgi:hypothetical protein
MSNLNEDIEMSDIYLINQRQRESTEQNNR